MFSKKINFNLKIILSILAVITLFFTSLVWADTNGIWVSASDIIGGTFGSDEQEIVSFFAFANPVYFNSLSTFNSGLIISGNINAGNSSLIFNDSTSQLEINSVKITNGVVANCILATSANGEVYCSNLSLTPVEPGVSSPPICLGLNKALQWDGSSWTCISISGGTSGVTYSIIETLASTSFKDFDLTGYDGVEVGVTQMDIQINCNTAPTNCRKNGFIQFLNSGDSVIYTSPISEYCDTSNEAPNVNTYSKTIPANSETLRLRAYGASEASCGNINFEVQIYAEEQNNVPTYGEDPNYEANLIDASHTGLNCIQQGGMPFNVGDNTYICKFDAASCPAGWTQYNKWSATQQKTCSSCQNSCTTSSHFTFKDQSVETCGYNVGQYVQEEQCVNMGGGDQDCSMVTVCSPWYYGTCSADVVSIGCK